MTDPVSEGFHHNPKPGDLRADNSEQYLDHLSTRRFGISAILAGKQGVWKNDRLLQKIRSIGLFEIYIESLRYR